MVCKQVNLVFYYDVKEYQCEGGAIKIADMNNSAAGLYIAYRPK